MCLITWHKVVQSKARVRWLMVLVGLLLALGATPEASRVFAAEPLTYETSPKEMLGAQAAAGGQIWAAAYSPNGASLVIGSGSWNVRGALTLWDVAARRPKWTATHRLGIRRVAFAPDSQRIAAAVYGGRVVVHDAANGDTLFSLKNGDGHVYAVAFSPDGQILASGGSDGLVYLINPATGELDSSFQAHSAGGVFILMFGDDGALYSAGGDALAKRWDLGTRSETARFTGHEGPIEALAVSADGKQLVTGGWDKTIRMWDSGGELIRMIGAHQAAVLSLAFSPDGKLLASGTGQWGNNNPLKPCELKLWEAASGAEVANVEGIEAREKLFTVTYIDAVTSDRAVQRSPLVSENGPQSRPRCLQA